MRHWYLAGALAALAVSAHAEGYRQEFPYPKAAVYAALVAELPASGFKIKEQDATISRVTASAPMSAFSYGENLSIGVVDAGPDKSVLELDSQKKIGFNVTANGRGQKHFDTIVMAVSKRLQATKP